VRPELYERVRRTLPAVFSRPITIAPAIIWWSKKRKQYWGKASRLVFGSQSFGLSVLPALRSMALPSGQSFTLASFDEPGGGSYLLIRSFFREYCPVTKLYVGNLPFTATDEAVNALFSKHGTVEKVSLITDRDTGRPRGFAFVEMSNADASRAMQALNGTDFDGRALKVSEAQERERSGGGGRPRRY
jgi:hypothetical protein